MRISELLTKTLRSVPKDEVAVNAELLTRGGFIYKNSAGVYSFLPLGWRVMQKIAALVRGEMDAIGGQEMFLPALIEKKYFDATKRSSVEIGFEVKGKKGAAGEEEGKGGFILGWTHEEVVTAIAQKYLHSYRDLPVALYQIQTKFRNEARVKSGLLRGREFLMKDLYSLHASKEDFERFYGNVAGAYRRIFERAGLHAIYTVAAGGDFTESETHEFQVVSPVGEDAILACVRCAYAENKEISKLKGGAACPRCEGEMQERKSIEVGNIFPLGEIYAKALGLTFVDREGKANYPVMGSYGIGLGRLMGAVVEVHHDKNGIMWPDSIAPFQVHLVELKGASAGKLYDHLQREKIEVLYDDRDASAGEKFADADLLGIPWRVVVSPKTGAKAEIKRRNEEKAELVSIPQFLKTLNPKP